MKIGYKIVHFFIIVICLIVQIVFVEHLSIYHIAFDLIMIAVIGVSIFDGVLYGISYGFAAGILLDLMTGSIIGINALVYSINAFIVGKIMDFGFKQKILTYVLIIFSITELNLLVINGVYYLFNFNSNFKELGIELLINPVFNILFMFLIFPLLHARREKKDEFGFAYKDKI
jgi:rod shape-determining protein MreD